jgi:H+/Cl- antiporter ClcA
MGVVHLLIQIMNLDIVFTVSYFIVFALISFIVCYFYVFRNDKYMQYFKEFEKWPKAERNRRTYLSIAFMIAVLGLFIGSFML